MDKLKKIKTKIFKSKQPKDQPLYMPVRPSYETEEIVLLGSPPAHYIQMKPEERYPDWCKCEVDPDDFSRPYFPRRPYVEKKIVDQFPAPPTTIPEKPLHPIVKPAPKRPSVRPPTMDFCDFTPEKLPPKRPSVRPPTLDFSPYQEGVHPEYPQQSKTKVDTFDAAAAARNAARLRARQRTPSSVSGQTPPLNVRRRNVSTSNAPLHPSGGMYKSHAASQSMRNLNPKSNYRACLPSQRQATDAGTHSASDSSGSIYSCSSAAHSAYNLSPDVRYYASNSTPAVPPISSQRNYASSPAPAIPPLPSQRNCASNSTPAVPPVPSRRNYASNSTPTAPPLPSRKNSELEGASVCRRNASSASSRSVHATRRHGMLPPPVGSQHHEILRILRGPHAAKLETPHVPSRTNEDIGLPVNDTKSSKEWGAKSSRVAGGASTVAGYGRSAGVRRY